MSASNLHPNSGKPEPLSPGATSIDDLIQSLECISEKVEQDLPLSPEEEQDLAYVATLERSRRRSIISLKVIAATLAVVSIILSFLLADSKLGIFSNPQNAGTPHYDIKYIGAFPENMMNIIKIVTEAKKRLIVLTDVAGYGHFSNATVFEQYRAALLQKSVQGTKTYVTVLSSKKVKEERAGQFLSFSATDFLSEKYSAFWKVNDERREKRKRFLELVEQLKDPKGELLEYIGSQEKAYRGDLRRSRNITLSEANSDYDIFCWIADDRVAVFSILVHSHFRDAEHDSSEAGLHEASFLTHNQSIIHNLLRYATGHSGVHFPEPSDE